jgi:hypothetical protein
MQERVMQRIAVRARVSCGVSFSRWLVYLNHVSHLLLELFLSTSFPLRAYAEEADVTWGIDLIE